MLVTIGCTQGLAMLNDRYVFPLIMVEEPVEDIQKFLSEDPAPGIDPVVDAKVIRVEPDDDGMVKAHVEMSVESFLRNGIQYGEEPYDLLTDIRDICGKEVATAAHRFLKDSTDLSVAKIGVSEGQIQSDQWPVNPNL